jgi:hypothetical protein
MSLRGEIIVCQSAFASHRRVSTAAPSRSPGSVSCVVVVLLLIEWGG